MQTPRVPLSMQTPMVPPGMQTGPVVQTEGTPMVKTGVEPKDTPMVKTGMKGVSPLLPRLLG